MKKRTYPNNLKYYREFNGFSAAYVANLLNISTQRYYERENGTVKNIKPDELKILSDTYKVSIEELLSSEVKKSVFDNEKIESSIKDSFLQSLTLNQMLAGNIMELNEQDIFNMFKFLYSEDTQMSDEDILRQFNQIDIEWKNEFYANGEKLSAAINNMKKIVKHDDDSYFLISDTILVLIYALRKYADVYYDILKDVKDFVNLYKIILKQIYENQYFGEKYNIKSTLIETKECLTILHSAMEENNIYPELCSLLMFLTHYLVMVCEEEKINNKDMDALCKMYRMLIQSKNRYILKTQEILKF